MNYDGSFKTAIEELHKQSSCAVFARFCKWRFDLVDLPVDNTLDLFDKFVTPVMLYAYEVGIWTNICIGKIKP